MNIGDKVYFTRDGLTAYGIVHSVYEDGYEATVTITEVIDARYSGGRVGDTWGIDKANIKEYPGHNPPIDTLKRLLADLPVSAEDKHAAEVALSAINKAFLDGNLPKSLERLLQETTS